VGHSNVSPDTAQLGGGSVEDITARADRPIDVGLEIRQLGKMIDELEQKGKSRLDSREPEKRAS
jgi:hypothetical protein